MKRIIIWVLSALLVPAAMEGSAHAVSFYDVIPASACQLEHEDDIGKVDLVGGSWMIGASIENAEVELLCPVRIAPFYVLGMTKDDLILSSIEIFYRDPDGMSPGHSVTATLFEVQPTLSPTNLGSISSNSITTTTDTRHDELLSAFGEPLNNAQHFIRVVMTQGSNDGTNRVRFTRVRLFPAPPIAP